MRKGRLAGARPVRLMVLAPAPVFYHVPLYRALRRVPGLEVTVVYASDSGIRPYSAGFGGRPIVWDEDLLSGYSWKLLNRATRNDLSRGFFGLRDWDVVSEVLGGHYDIIWIHGYAYLTNWLAAAGAVLARKQLLIRDEQTLLHPRPFLKGVLRTLLLRALFLKSRGLYIGSNNRSFFRAYGLPPERLYWVPYSVDESVETQSVDAHMAKTELRRRFGIMDQSGPVVLFVGKLIDKKQPLLLLKAFEEVRNQWPCVLLIVGTGPLESEIRHQVELRRIPDVHFGAFLNRSQIGAAYAVADVFVLPSRIHETWGVVVNEAMHFSLPVVVSDKVGSGPDLVRHGYNGYVVRHNDVAGFANAISALVRDDNRRRIFGRRSKDLVATWTHLAAAAGVVQACNDAIRRCGAELNVPSHDTEVRTHRS